MSRFVVTVAVAGLVLMACAGDPASTVADEPAPESTVAAPAERSSPEATVPLLAEPVMLAVGETTLVPVKFDPGELLAQARSIDGAVQLVIRERSMTDNSFRLVLGLVERTTGAEVLLDEVGFFDQRSAFADPDVLVRSDGEFGYFFADVTDALREIAGIGSTDFDLSVSLRPIHDDEISELTFSLNDVSLVAASK